MELSYTMIDKLKEHCKNAFTAIDSIEPATDETEDKIDDALHYLCVAQDSLDFIRESYQEILIELKTLLDNLDKIDLVVQEKIENPYSQTDFVSIGKK
jgi:mannitol-1-phosphate/altronate dehydrogenase